MLTLHTSLSYVYFLILCLNTISLEYHNSDRYKYGLDICVSILYCYIYFIYLFYQSSRIRSTWFPSHYPFQLFTYEFLSLKININPFSEKSPHIFLTDRIKKKNNITCKHRIFFATIYQNYIINI